MPQCKAEEFKLQASCVMWLWNNYPETRGHFILIDNNATSVIATMQKRSMGLIRGASDTFFFWNKKVYFIEFKTETGKQSDAQIIFEAKANEHSEGYFIIRNLSDFIKLMESILRPIS